MIKNNVLGIIFANSNDELLPQFTSKRAVASIPFGGRYRLIDFSLSNLVNAGISKVGVITKSNYNSLLDHLGSGISWDLDRKNGGLFMLPPFSTDKAGFFNGKIDALAGIMTFLTRSNEEYVVMCDSDIVSNIDIDKLISAHKQSGATITLAYKKGFIKNVVRDTKALSINQKGEVTAVNKIDANGEYNYCLDIYVIRREDLISMVNSASKYNSPDITKQMLLPTLGEIKVGAYEVKEFAEIIYSKERYAEISMSLLEREKRGELFNSERPVYTKTRDDMPTRYGVEASTANALIAGSCVIEGKVQNSVVFRGVDIGKGTDIADCIIMQGTKIGKNCKLQYVITDKAAVISDGMTLIGTPDNYIYVGKEKFI